MSIFDDVRICMDDKELSLLCKLDEYKLKLNECAIEQIQIDSKLAATQTIIGRNLERIQEQEAFCEDVINDGNAKNDGRIQNIIDEAEFAFEQSASAMDATKDAMNEQYVHNGAVCCIDLDESHLRIIKEHFESFIDVRSVADKELNQECKIKIVKKVKINKNSKAYLHQQMNSLKHRLKDANKAIVKFKKNKRAKPKKVESASPKTKFIRKFDKLFVDASKWRLMNEGHTLRGIWRPNEPSCQKRYWCVPLQCFSAKNGRGVYSCSIKWTFFDDDDNRNNKLVKLNWSCGSCIGVTNERSRKLLEEGVSCSKRWPDWANDSHFDATVDAPWYLNETITVELDLDSRLVTYKKDESIIKTDTLDFKQPKACYLMLSSEAVISSPFAYSVIFPKE